MWSSTDGRGFNSRRLHHLAQFEWISKVGERKEMESSMLEFSENLKPTSRLSCQIQVSEELNGLVVKLPEAQY